MFSQFRQAVESLAQQSQENLASTDGRSRSPDPLRQPSAQLPENALVNLRKSIAAQRIAGPTQQSAPRARSASPGSTSTTGSRKTTLEERLRASLAGPEPSASSTSKPPTSASPAPKGVPIIALAPVPDSPRPTPDDTSITVDNPIRPESSAGSALKPPTSPPTPQTVSVTTPAPALGSPNPVPDATIDTPTDSSVRPETPASSAPKPLASALPSPRTLPVTTSTPASDSPKPLPDATSITVDTPADSSVRPEEGGRTADLLTSQESNDPGQSLGTTPSADTQPDPVSSPLNLADVVHIDSNTDPVDLTSAQQVRQETETKNQQPLVRPCTDASEVIGVSTVDADPPGEGGAKSEPTVTDKSNGATVEALQERLRLVEQRFSEVSTSFKKLQVERRNTDGVISELTPLKGSKDVAALREYLVNVNMRIELGQDELQRLNGKLTRQEERLEELQDTYKRETVLQSDQTEKLRRQLNEAEALIATSQSTVSQTEEDKDKRDSEVEQLRAELTRTKEMAKEEEEKSGKAITLLRNTRQKSVKAEKERDDALRELSEARNRNLEEKEKDRVDRANLEKQVNAANAEREKAVTGLRAQFDKDIATIKDRAEKDIQAVRQQFDADLNAQKTSYLAEISAKKLRINTLENTVANITGENRSLFEQLELRQAELESSQCHSESLQAQNTELQFQLKELQERTNLLTDEVGELRGEHEMQLQVAGVTAEEVSQLVSSVEAKYERKLSELKRTLLTAEKERTEAEATWSRKLTDKTKETEKLKHMLQSSVQLREQDEDVTGALKAEMEKLQSEVRSQQSRIYELQTHIEASKETELILHRRLSEAVAQVDDSEKQLEESKSRETQMHTQNKVLRDELRKVHNSVAVLERQRSPGTAYWASRPNDSNSRTSISSITDAPSPPSPPVARNDEEISHEYLRNVILQFLEHKEMRPNLVRVLSTILHFTPQETRRLMSKV